MKAPAAPHEHRARGAKRELEETRQGMIDKEIRDAGFMRVGAIQRDSEQAEITGNHGRKQAPEGDRPSVSKKPGREEVEKPFARQRPRHSVPRLPDFRMVRQPVMDEKEIGDSAGNRSDVSAEWIAYEDERHQ